MDDSLEENMDGQGEESGDVKHWMANAFPYAKRGQLYDN
ncbi:hypothetical protein BRO54_1857 [Geobacillus proteiniphilus]|uniref:Uncharacterized protein n=1 Tax=Geobacillus proteiniphilus TaxID=860353 RepID=A0A1Q5SZR5_9BACL|nr:hypothetical protein BRO54_1857 [Geobacillus proteiniphilus]